MFGYTSLRPNMIAHFHSMKKLQFVFNEDTKKLCCVKGEKNSVWKAFSNDFLSPTNHYHSPTKRY